MQIKILGCSGGIGADLRTTAILLDSDILVDAGSGVGDLPMDALLKIDHIFVSHAHLDHIAFIPLLLDTVMGLREKPITVHATTEILAVLRTHIFNWKVWPDFNAIPDANNPFLQYGEVTLGETVNIAGRKFTAIPVDHVVPAVGYHIEGDHFSLVYTGDTSSCDALWAEVNRIVNLKYLIIETAFSNAELELAKLSKHLCPSTLASELAKLELANFKDQPEIYITHLKPGECEVIMHEIAAAKMNLSIEALRAGQIFHI